MSLIISFLSAGGPYAALMLIQPSPKADTSRLLPSFRVFIFKLRSVGVSGSRRGLGTKMDIGRSPTEPTKAHRQSCLIEQCVPKAYRQRSEFRPVHFTQQSALRFMAY